MGQLDRPVPPGQGPDALVVDDDQAMRCMLVEILRSFGITSIGCSSCAEALAAWHTMLRKGARPRIVLCDDGLGDGTALDVLHAIAPDAGPCILAVFSYGTGAGRRRELAQAGTHVLLDKKDGAGALARQLKLLLAPPSPAGDVNRANSSASGEFRSTYASALMLGLEKIQTAIMERDASLSDNIIHRLSGMTAIYGDLDISERLARLRGLGTGQRTASRMSDEIRSIQLWVKANFRDILGRTWDQSA